MTTKKINAKAYGNEPLWDEKISSEDAPFAVVTKSYWYRVYSTPKQLKKWTLSYVEDNYGKKEQPNYTGGNKYSYETAGSLCRLIERGCPLDFVKDSIESVLEAIKIDTLVKKSRLSSSIKNLSSDKPKVDQKQKFNDQLAEYVYRVNSEIDRLIDFPKLKKKDWWDAENYFKSKNIKPEFAVEITNQITPMLNELKESLEGECEQLTEAYDFLKRRYHTRLIEFVTEIVKVSKKYSNRRVLTKAGKKKKKKSTTPAVIVKKLPYLEKFGDVTSVDPKEVIGASVVYVYNTVSRLICVYIASDTKGLSVKGASITGYDEKKSFVKKLRSPKHSIFMVSTGKVKKYALEHVKNVKTKEKPIRPRLNKNCIILKVF
jgi:hypothetical protein